MPVADYIDGQNEITWAMRQTLIDWLLQVHLRYHLMPETLWIATNIIDRFLSKRVVSMVKLQLVGITAMFIAAKYEEILAPSVDEFVFMTEKGYKKEEILKGERIILESLEFNIYHTWMLETKKRLSKMVIPALIESQSLPGFTTTDGGGRLFNRLLNSNTQPAYSMDDILNLLNKVWRSLKSYYMEESVVQQVITELLKLIGVTSFNDLLMRRNFSSWKRGMYYR